MQYNSVLRILFLSVCINLFFSVHSILPELNAFGGRQDDITAIPEPEEAAAAYYRGRLDESINLYTAIISRNPENRSAGISLAFLFMESGRHDEAYAVLSDFRQLAADNTFPDGALWEDPSFPLFLSGSFEKYLQSTVNVFAGNARESFQKDIAAEKLFFRGWALSDTGKTSEAATVFKEALKLRDYFPAAGMMLGIIQLKNEKYSESEHYLNLALRQDNNLTQARPFLAQAILAQGRIAEAYSAFRRVTATRPWDRLSAEAAAELAAANPSLTAAAVQAARTRRVVASAPSADRFTSAPETMPQVRVGLGENLRETYIKTGGNFSLEDSRGKLILEGKKDIIYRVNITSGRIIFYSEEGVRQAEAAEAVTLSYDNPSSTTIIFDISYNVGYQSAGQEDRSYRGELAFLPRSPGGMTIVNTLPIEEYLYSVIPSEMPSWWPAQALAAQAVAARSYTLANMGRFRARGFDLQGSIESAFYRGYTGEKETSSAAVDATRGLVMKSSGKYMNAYYSANSAGRTESARSVWGTNEPLIGATDPDLVFNTNPPAPDELARWILSEPPSYSSVPDHHYRQAYRWRLIVSREEIEARIGKDIGTVIAITTLGRGSSGRVEEVLVKGTAGELKIRGDTIRSRLGGLRSNLFIVMPRHGADGITDSFIFAGAGWGHGVGMCQSGAAGMAAKGFKAEEILKHYYPLAELEKEY